MIKPEEIENIDNYNLDEIEKQIDESIKSYHGWHPWEEAILDGEYPVAVRNKIAERYVANGWKYVYHRTTSENGEKPGLTGFKFSMEPLKDEYVKASHCIKAEAAEIYLKIYVENGDTLVFEGQGEEDKDGYYPTRWDDKVQRIGTVVVGKEHISITKEAKEALIRIITESRHTGDDLSCIDIHTAYRKVDGAFEETPTDVCVSYVGAIVTKLNIEETIHDDDFFIGCGEGSPKLELLDELIQV